MYIVAIMMTALVFSITGLGVLDLGRVVTQNTEIATESMQAQVEMESFMNVALWRLNTGADSLANYSSGPITSSYDSTCQILSVQYSDGELNTGYSLDLSEDSHFKRALATTNYFYSGSWHITTEPEHQVRDDFAFLPEVDMAYWMAHADSVYTGYNRYYYDWDLIEGVLIFTGNHLTFRNIDVENTTMIFTQNDIEFYQNNEVRAYQTGETVYPALIFTDSSSVFWVNEWWGTNYDHINGAIFSNGTVVLRRGDLSGPVVARNAYLYRDMDFLDEEYPQYYQWPQGFGAYDSYDWPKQISMWEPL